MKYVMLETKTNSITKRTPFIFPSYLSHDIIAEVMKKTLETIMPDQKVEIISAGDLNFIGSVECFGYSESLNLRSLRIEDEEVIDTYDYLHGIVG